MDGDDVKAIGAKLDRLTEGQAELRARVEVSLEQHKREILALFQYHAETSKTLGEIRQTACLRSEFQHQVELQAKTQTENREQMASIREQMAPLVAASARRAAIWAAVITAGVTQGVNWLVQFSGRMA
jgi:hypothetical protein